MKEIVNIDEFILFMEKAVHTEINSALRKDIREKMYKIREAFEGSSKLAWRWILETDDNEEVITKNYEQYLLQVYSNYITFISDSFITYIFYNLIHKNRVINNRAVDVDDMYLYQFRDFQIKLMKIEREYLRQLKNKDDKYQKLFDEFVEVITDAKYELSVLHKNIFKEKGEQNGR
jgi:hypothetical protein